MQKKEEWCRVKPPFPGDLARFGAKVQKDRQGDCLNWVGACGEQGHGVFWFAQRRWPAHRLRLAWANEEEPRHLWCLHSCGNAACVNRDHLYWGTPSQNSADRRAHGTFWIDGAYASCKLNKQQVVDIWFSYNKTEESIESIVKRVGTTRGNIYAILSGKIWSHLTANLTPFKKRPPAKHFGTKHHRATLSEETVKIIRRRYDAGEKFRALAEEYGMVKSAMWRICRRKAWVHVPG